ncbi:MAG: CHAT domain-containing protein [Burkholderiaceae bacterium]|nr:MAG: CHAT domain-containing protein [Burkholderiaceae bacterium]
MSTQGAVVQLQWHAARQVLMVASTRTLASVLKRMDATRPEWVMVVRAEAFGIYRYAYRPRELVQLANESTDMRDRTLDAALELHEWKSSGVTRGGRPVDGAHPGNEGKAAQRVIELDAAGNVVAIGENTELKTGAELDLLVPSFRGSASVDPGAARAAPEAVVESTLSAQVPGEIALDAEKRVTFRVELAAEARPLAQRRDAKILADHQVVVVLTVENENLTVIGAREHRVDPPSAGQPRVGFFTVKGQCPGPVRLALVFRQAKAELGTIELALEVVEGQPRTLLAKARSDIAVLDPDDDNLLDLLIEQRTVNGALCYEYRLHGEGLGFNYLTLQSRPLLDRGDGPASTAVAYVERIYQRVTRELKSWNDLEQLQREVRALGVSLSDELFDPDVVKALWPLRNRIGLIRVTSWEPFIPWELLRLRDPLSGVIDDRHFAEYGLVRTLAGEAPPRKLELNDWRYLSSDFPLGTHAPAVDLTYFTDTLPNQRSLHPTRIPACTDDLYDALAAGDFDVLHLACHAESPQGAIDRATLIIDDQAQPGSAAPRLIEADSVTVKAEAQLRKRRPLVFLNACETGRAGAMLTAWGGWPEIFVRAGAGAFVGTAWAVREKPAAAFAQAFYEALLDGRLLHEAASAARAAAKAAGDASWLAFKVYGHPRAKRA